MLKCIATYRVCLVGLDAKVKRDESIKSDKKTQGRENECILGGKPRCCMTDKRISERRSIRKGEARIVSEEWSGVLEMAIKMSDSARSAKSEN